MKRFMVVLMMLLLLVGCGQVETPASEPEEVPQVTEPAPEEKEVVPVPEEITVPEPQEETEPEPEPAPVPAPQPEPVDPVPEQSTVPEPQVPAEAGTEEPEPESEDLAELAAGVYTAITEDKAFNVWILEPDGTVTQQTVEPGRNDWNVANREYVFRNYVWTEATEEEWNELERSETRGNRLCLSEPGEWGVRNLFCYSGGDLVCLVNETEVRYLRAVNPREGELFEWKLYGVLEIIAQDAMSAEVWNATADGSLSPEEAAWELACQVAENHRNVPEWVSWGVVDMQAAETEIFDLYRGYPEQFCCNMGWRLQLPDSPEDSYWVAGAGASEPDEDNWRTYFVEALVEKNEDGNWSLIDRGTGGYSVNPKRDDCKTQVERLVELFCLTEGFTHDWLAPNWLLDLPPDQMAALPAILDQLTEEESRELCSVLGALLRQEDQTWEYTVETLKPLLGDYGVWLDA